VGTAHADFVFGEPTDLGSTVNSSAEDSTPNISTDGLELYFRSNRSGGSGNYDVWVTTRDTTDDEWGPPVNLGPAVNTSATDSCPSVSADGLSLFLMSNRTGGHGGMDMWVTTRPTTNDPWTTPVNLGTAINSSANDGCPSISADGLTLFYKAGGLGGYGGDDLWASTRTAADEDWPSPANLGATVNTAYTDCCPSISGDDLALFFHSDRPGSLGFLDVWVTTRADVSEPWRAPVNLGTGINTPSYDWAPDVSSDGLTLFFASNRSGGSGADDIWQVSISPVVDFNGDGKVDGAEILTMVDHWGTDHSLCDISPPPWGDGVVDVEDLKVLARYIGEELNDPTLVAHWAMDETGGFVAHDSAGDNDGRVMGFPVWRPGAGRVDGALQLDGTGFVSADQVLDPSDGPLSVLAWVKGGLPGQVIVSQEGGANWLMIDPVDGTLMTGLRSGGRSPEDLDSQAAIADNNWHLVAFTWDGANRRLYVDNVLVAEDAQDALKGAVGRQLIGCGQDMTPVTYFTGLIDDVRIYNRAVRP
jgi:hypothetical protein